MRRGGVIVAIAAASLAAGCATLNEEECLTADWVGIGFTDGTEGYSPARLNEHAEACSRYDLGVDAAAWRRGYEDGLVRYCTPFSGASAGARGETYRGVCPSQLEGAFLTAYSEGREVRRVWEYYQDELRRIARIEDDIDNRTDRIEDLRARLDNEELSEDEIAQIRAEIRGLRRDRRNLREEYDAASYAIERVRNDAYRDTAIFESRFPGAGPSSWR